MTNLTIAAFLDGGFMHLSLKAIVIATATLAAIPVAQAQSIGAEATVARAHDRWGGELGVGYALKFGPVSLRQIAGAFLYQGDNDRYYQDTFSNGQQRCRDSQTGQFADDVKCNNLAAKWYVKGEAIVAIPLFADVGAGIRLSGEKARPYGTVAVPLAPKLKLKGNVGGGYVAAGINFGF